MTSDLEQEFDLRHILDLLRRRAWWIIGVLAVLVIGTLAVDFRLTPQYQAVAEVRVTDPNAETLFDGVNIRVDQKREVDTQVRLIKSPSVRREVDQRLGDRASEISEVEVEGAGQTDIIEIKVSSPVPEVARDAANAFAQVFVENRREQVVAALDQRAEELRGKADELNAQLAELDRQIAAGGADTESLRIQRAGLVQQQQDFRKRASELEVEAAIRTGNVNIATEAELPTTPVSPQPLRDVAVAIVAALVIGVGLAFIVERLDDRIEAPEQAEAAAGVQVLGSIPIYAPNKKRAPKHMPHGERTLVPLESLASEAYRTFRTNVRFSGLGKAKQTIVVTSPSGSEGKSTVTANLAKVLAESGLRVVVISADLRRPVISRFFGVDENETGLTTALMGDVPVTDCMRRVDFESGQRLFLLPAGPLPHNPAELLGSKAMADLLDQIERAGVDFVLIDSPPVLPVADSLALAQFADGVILLAVPGQTREHSLKEAADRLRKVEADLIGVVLNGVPLQSRRYPYGYYYRRYERDQSRKQTGNGSKRDRDRARAVEAEEAV